MAEAGNVAKIREYLSKGGKVGARSSKDGRTILHAAALSGNRELCELLVKAGADWRVEDRYGSKPTDLASLRGHGKLAAYLRNPMGMRLCLIVSDDVYLAAAAPAPAPAATPKAATSPKPKAAEEPKVCCSCGCMLKLACVQPKPKAKPKPAEDSDEEPAPKVCVYV